MDNELYEFVKACGFKRFPHEACGLIYSDRIGRPHYVECENVSDEPEHRFLIAPEEMRKVEKMGKIVGCWHTHCNEAPVASPADKEACRNTDVPWLIGAVFKNDEGMKFSGLTVVEPDERYKTPLLGRSYVFGVFDCVSLMRDFYKQEFDIDLPEVPRYERMWEKEKDVMRRVAVDDLGFVRLKDDEPPQYGDVFLIQIGQHGEDHIAIYIGDDKIMHQLRSRLSRVDVYGGSYWQERTLTRWRHKTKCSRK